MGAGVAPPIRLGVNPPTEATGAVPAALQALASFASGSWETFGPALGGVRRPAPNSVGGVRRPAPIGCSGGFGARCDPGWGSLRLGESGLRRSNIGLADRLGAGRAGLCR